MTKQHLLLISPLQHSFFAQLSPRAMTGVGQLLDAQLHDNLEHDAQRSSLEALRRPLREALTMQLTRTTAQLIREQVYD
jgi:hypothetical protein